MKSLFMKSVLVLILGLGSVGLAQALPFPDPLHPPLGPGDVEPPVPLNTFEGSWMVSQMFTVPTEGTTISFDYNFLTSEFNGETYRENDVFGIALFNNHVEDSGPVQFYYLADVSNSTFSPLPKTTGPHGSYFTHETGVLSDSITIFSPYGGTDVKLAFAIFDSGDGFVDSGVLIDNISLPVPNGNFSGGLLGPGGFIGQEKGWDTYGGNVHLLPDGSLTGVDTTGFEGNYAYLSTGPGVMIPEPATLLLLGSGLLGMVMRSKKRK